MMVRPYLTLRGFVGTVSGSGTAGWGLVVPQSWAGGRKIDYDKEVRVMRDRHVSATMVSSIGLWVIGAAMMTAGLWDLRFMGWGLWFSGLGGVLSVRKMMCRQETRIRNAFELGRDYGRVRALR